MTLWLLLTLTTLWLALCTVAVSLCVMAARGDRVQAVGLRAVPDRHSERRPLRLRRPREAWTSPARSDVTRLRR
jgi:hypothetical protein